MMNKRKKMRKKKRCSEVQHRSGRGGWTLIELLVAISLSVILVAAMAEAFARASDVFQIGNARLEIYKDVRSALDIMGRDLMGAVSTDSDNQRFTVAQNIDDQFESTYQHFNGNGWQIHPGDPINANPSGQAADFLGFVSTTSIAGSVKGRGLAYRLVPSKDPDLLDTGEGRSETIYYKRILGVMQRTAIPVDLVKNDPNIYYGPDKSNSGSLWKKQNSGPGTSYPDVFVGYMAEYILSFNIEILVDNNNTDVGYFDLDETSLTAPEANYVNPDPDINYGDYPLGDNNPVTEPGIPEALRITIRFTEGASGRQERVVQRIFWLPMK